MTADLDLLQAALDSDPHPLITVDAPDLQDLIDRVRAAEARVADVWDEGHRTPWQRGPSGCVCFAQSVVECGCGKYGTGPIITPNPYRTEANRG